MRNLLGKAEGAQNLDGNRLEGSLLRPLGQKLRSASRAHQGGRTHMPFGSQHILASYCT